MRRFLLGLPEHFQAVLFIAFTILVAFLSAYVCSLFFDTDQLAANSALISAVYQVMGTIYAILLTFTLWGVWQNFSSATTSVQNEAYSLLDLVHTIEASTDWQEINIRLVALTYATEVAQKEWPKLKNYTNSVINQREYTHPACMEVVRAVQRITPQNEKDSALFTQTLNLLANWLNARRSRMLIARGNSAKALWPLLLTGAVVLFAFHGLFVAQTVGIWATLLFGTALVIGLTFYLIFSLDCPFAGSLCIDAEPFELAINILKSEL